MDSQAHILDVEEKLNSALEVNDVVKNSVACLVHKRRFMNHEAKTFDCQVSVSHPVLAHVDSVPEENQRIVVTELDVMDEHHVCNALVSSI